MPVAKRYTYKNESLTLREWSIQFGITPDSLRAQLRHGTVEQVFAKAERDREHAFVPWDGTPPLHVIAKRNGARMCRNPDTGDEKLAFEWAQYYGVETREFYQVARKLGSSSPKLYRYFEQRRRSA
jgi:AraC-like DNA-binding protein